MTQQPTFTLLAWRASFEEGAKAAAAGMPSLGPSKAAEALGGILSDLYSNAERGESRHFKGRRKMG